MDRIEDKSVDLILTDLPYGLTAAKWDKNKAKERIEENGKK